MRTVEHFRWWVTSPGRKRPHLTSFLMDADTATSQYHGCRPEPSSCVLRQVPETEAEVLKAQFDYQSAGHDSVRPPRS